MGYNADSTLDLYVPNDKVAEFRKELVAVHLSQSSMKGDNESLYEDTLTGDLIVMLVNEDPGADEEVIGNEHSVLAPEYGVSRRIIGRVKLRDSYRDVV